MKLIPCVYHRAARGAVAVFRHPTVSETMREAVLDAWGRVIYF